MRTVSFPALVMVFPVYGVTGVVALVLNSPVLARVLVHVRPAHFFPSRAGYLDGDVLAYFLSGQAVYLAADTRHLGDMREIDLSCFRYPAGPRFDDSVTAVGHNVVGVPGE